MYTKRKDSKHATIENQEERKRKRIKQLQNSQKTINKSTICTFLSIITFNVNGLNTLIKRQEWHSGLKNKTHFR